MNQVREWEGRCQRCMRDTDIHIMSMFDVALICMECWEGEKQHPSYKTASDAERSAIKNGDLNFKGIGYTNEK
jgi:hypothetical protein